MNWRDLLKSRLLGTSTTISKRAVEAGNFDVLRAAKAGMAHNAARFIMEKFAMRPGLPPDNFSETYELRVYVLTADDVKYLIDAIREEEQCHANSCSTSRPTG